MKYCHEVNIDTDNRVELLGDWLYLSYPRFSDRVFYNCQIMKKVLSEPPFTYWFNAFYLISTENDLKNIAKGTFNLLQYFSTIFGICQYYFED